MTKRDQADFARRIENAVFAEESARLWRAKVDVVGGGGEGGVGAVRNATWAQKWRVVAVQGLLRCAK